MTSSVTSSEVFARDLLACRLVDLSSDLTLHEKGPFETRIDAVEALDATPIFCERLVPQLVPEAAGRLRPEHFPDGAFLRHEMVTLSTHAGSHIDAPGHYGPTADGSRGHINDAPLGAFIGRGVMLDVTGIQGWQVERHHVRAALDASGVDNFEQTIVLIHTEPDKAISAEVVEDLIDLGVRVIGSDVLGFDGGTFAPVIRRFLENEDPATLWPAHVIGRRRPYYQVERLRNLHLLPTTGSIVLTVPVLLEGVTAGWTRAIAFVPPGADQGQPNRPTEGE
jgi:cyclase